jgi:hypothetical protein
MSALCSTAALLFGLVLRALPALSLDELMPGSPTVFSLKLSPHSATLLLNPKNPISSILCKIP